MDRADKKRTKIVATISDLNCDAPFIRQLYEEGMDVVRLNTAHQERGATMKVVENVRKASYRIALLLDTKGPEIRTLPGATLPLEVKEGDLLRCVTKVPPLAAKEPLRFLTTIFRKKSLTREISAFWLMMATWSC
ncbi:MAG: pyruvate kinase [Bacteroidales bacterium]|nr:pyruvate kinase [Bacteroidales bacterium]